MMLYDAQETGAAAEDLLVRRGKSWESAKRLEAQATLAEQAGLAQNGVPLGHGVFVTSPTANESQARDPEDSVSVARQTLEQSGFSVRYTPTKKDADHHTVQLPKPVTEEVAAAFNAAFGRKKRK